MVGPWVRRLGWVTFLPALGRGEGDLRLPVEEGFIAGQPHRLAISFVPVGLIAEDYALVVVRVEVVYC